MTWLRIGDRLNHKQPGNTEYEGLIWGRECRWGKQMQSAMRLPKAWGLPTLPLLPLGPAEINVCNRSSRDLRATANLKFPGLSPLSQETLANMLIALPL